MNKANCLNLCWSLCWVAIRKDGKSQDHSRLKINKFIIVVQMPYPHKMKMWGWLGGMSGNFMTVQKERSVAMPGDLALVISGSMKKAIRLVKPRGKKVALCVKKFLIPNNCITVSRWCGKSHKDVICIVSKYHHFRTAHILRRRHERSTNYLDCYLIHQVAKSLTVTPCFTVNKNALTQSNREIRKFKELWQEP